MKELENSNSFPKSHIHFVIHAFLFLLRLCQKEVPVWLEQIERGEFWQEMVSERLGENGLSRPLWTIVNDDGGPTEV